MQIMYGPRIEKTAKAADGGGEMGDEIEAGIFASYRALRIYYLQKRCISPRYANSILWEFLFFNVFLNKKYTHFLLNIELFVKDDMLMVHE